MWSTDSARPKTKRPIDWLRYSGACVTITLNPWHWRWTPMIQRENHHDWPLGPNEQTWCVTWLMLTVRVWIDNGDW